MKKHDERLFQIGEVSKILGVTRKALLVYEEMGLLTPAVKDEESGYRYYSADNMTQIRSIRSLQTLGLTLKEVAEYYYATENIDVHLQRLMELRATLDRNIQMLQVRSAKQGDLTVHRTSLPRQVTMRMSQSSDKLDLLCCIPVEDDFEGPERREFPEAQALCIYYRGPYEGTSTAIRALMQYVKENNIAVTGPFRNIYMEGPPNRGENSGDYITQIAVPIKG